MKKNLSYIFAFATLFAYGLEINVTPNESVASAIQKAREAHKVNPSERVKLIFAPGEYALDEQLTLTAEDSLTEFVALKPYRTVFSGAYTLPKFRVDVRGVWVCNVPQGMYFEQLFVNGQRAVRAISPNNGYFYMVQPMGDGVHPFTGEEVDLNLHGFIGDVNEIRSLIGKPREELNEVVLRCFHSWYTFRTRLIDVAKNGRVMTTPVLTRPYFFWGTYQPRYQLENHKSFLDAAGEWFLDKKTSRLYYIPRKGETLDNTIATAPRLTHLMSVTGAHDIEFNGITFATTGYMLPAKGNNEGQAACDIDAAIELNNCEHVNFDRCSISRTAQHGIWFKRGCRNCSLLHSIIYDTGGSAVRVGDTRWSKTELPDKLTAFIKIDNNIFRSGGWVFPSSCGVFIAHASDVQLTHNDIGDYRYTGVSMGWTWGYSQTVAHRNNISWNHIHHIGWGVLNDMGGIYTLGNSPGTTIIGNNIHDVYSYDYTGAGGWGLYTDEGSANILFASNLVHHVKTGCVHQHYGQDNTFANNIFAYSMKNMIVRSRIEDHHTINVTNNIIYWDNLTFAVTGGLKGKAYAPDTTFANNVYWSTVAVTNNAFMAGSFEEWQAQGQDVGSVIADPMFVDAAHNDFHLKPNSPALKMGFKEWDYSQAGVYGEMTKFITKLGNNYPPVKFAKVPQRVQMLQWESDFDHVKKRNKKIGHMICNTDEKQGTRIELTTDGARGGKGKCLILHENPACTPSWYPHLEFMARNESGTSHYEFAMKVDAKTHVHLELRDYVVEGRPYVVGAIVQFIGTKVFANYRDATGKKVRKELGTVKEGEWTTFTLDIKAGENVTWSIVMKCDSGAEAKLTGLNCYDELYRATSWFGLISIANEEGDWYFDDFKYETRK